VQQKAFSLEIHCLKNNKSLKENSKIIAFNAYLDSNGLRVGGRLHYAKIPNKAKHPIILPAKHKVASLIYKTEYVKLNHCESEQLLYYVRQQY